ncbi:MAG: 16S rRNA (adenine(1518)-N(6)/adenine(1519)-N(6))-dimethyltransferase RsmA [Candidatus Omnitrophota bacterium]
MSSLLGRLKRELDAIGAQARRRLGQNFMIDSAALEAVASAALSDPSTALVEIGPGLGYLTEVLLASGRPVLAIEKDSRLAARLKAKHAGRPLTVLETDVLEADLADRIPSDLPVTVVGNIPYNITSPILEWMIGQRRHIRRAVLTIQREVAERLAAEPGTKAWGALSVFIQFYAEPVILGRFKPTCFYPAPKVDSAVVAFERFGIPRAEVVDEKLFFETVRRAFQKRRKMLLNALENRDDPRWSKSALAESLKAADIEPTLRPERLSIAQWAALCERIRTRKDDG